MRVLIDYRPALRERSGVGEYAHQLTASLARRREHPPLDLTLFSSSWKDRLALGKGELDGVTKVDRDIPVGLLNLAWHRLGWPPVELLTGRRFDVVHSPSPLLIPTRHAARVVTVHDLSFLDHPERTSAEIRRDYPALAASHARRADRVVAVSQFTARDVERRLGVAPERISICSPGAPDWHARQHAPADGYVLFFGTLEPRKNVGALLDAYERLLATRIGPTPALVLAGRATDETRDWLDRIARPPLRGVVRHLGYVDPGDRRALYEGARLLVQPSFEEGFGMTVLEAMTVGVPVVAANRGALPEVLGGAGTLVDADDATALADAIDRVIGNTAYASGCAEKGLIQARRFTWETTAERTLEAYRIAIEQRQCASG